jgi:hypothetical protein
MLTANLPLWTLATWQWVLTGIIIADVLLCQNNRGIISLGTRAHAG